MRFYTARRRTYLRIADNKPGEQMNRYYERRYLAGCRNHGSFCKIAKKSGMRECLNLENLISSIGSTLQALPESEERRDLARKLYHTECMFGELLDQAALREICEQGKYKDERNRDIIFQYMENGWLQLDGRRDWLNKTYGAGISD